MNDSQRADFIVAVLESEIGELHPDEDHDVRAWVRFHWDHTDDQLIDACFDTIQNLRDGW